MSPRDEIIKGRINKLVEWTKQEVEELKVVRALQEGVEKDEEGNLWKDAEDKIRHFPSLEDVGVEEKMVRLCATMAGGVYKTTHKKEFERILKDNPSICRDFPDLTLRFYQTGVTLYRMNSKSKVSLNAPTLAGVIVGDTLVLAYRGTVTLADMVADLQMESVQPWRSYPGMAVQGAYYNLVRNSYFGKKTSHKKDIINYIRGSYSKVPNKSKKDGTPIKRIIVSGHSLGGGLAQVTHLCMVAPSGEFDDLVEAIDSHDVEVKSVAFAAPMTTALVDPGQKTLTFLKECVEPNMRNICYRTDPVPRGYANLSFILDLLDDIKEKFMMAKKDENKEQIEKVLGFLKEGLLPWVVEYLEDKVEAVIDQAKKYRHVGKVIYYNKESEKPETFVDHDDEVIVSGTGDQPTFRGLPYSPSLEDPISEVLANHMFLVQEKGLGYLK